MKKKQQTQVCYSQCFDTKTGIICGCIGPCRVCHPHHEDGKPLSGMASVGVTRRSVFISSCRYAQLRGTRSNRGNEMARGGSPPPAEMSLSERGGTLNSRILVNWASPRRFCGGSWLFLVYFLFGVLRSSSKLRRSSSGASNVLYSRLWASSGGVHLQGELVWDALRLNRPFTPTAQGHVRHHEEDQ